MPRLLRDELLLGQFLLKLSDGIEEGHAEVWLEIVGRMRRAVGRHFLHLVEG